MYRQIVMPLESSTVERDSELVQLASFLVEPHSLHNDKDVKAPVLTNRDYSSLLVRTFSPVRYRSPFSSWTTPASRASSNESYVGTLDFFLFSLMGRGGRRVGAILPRLRFEREVDGSERGRRARDLAEG